MRNGRAFDGRNSWPLRRRSTAEAIRLLDADVIGLQEVYGFQQRYLERALPGYAAQGEGRSPRGRGERCPVLVRRGRFDLLAWRTRWFGAPHGVRGTRLPHASFPRTATIVRVRDRDTGTEIEVANTHLDEHRAENRMRSIEQLITWLSPDVPTVVLGDFNATDADPIFTPLRAAGFTTAVPGGAPGTAHDFSGRTDGRRIDHIVVSAHWEVLDAAVVVELATPTLPSDHWPLTATLRIPSRR